MNNHLINKREISLDLLRIISCFFIILRHITDNYKLLNDNWITAILLKAISYPALPIFVMLTGYLMFNKEESYVEFFKKRFNKIFFPFVFWSFICYEYLIHFTNSNINHNFIKVFFSNSIFYHLWYVYFIIGVYLLVPIIRKMLHSLSNRDLLYLILLWVVTNSIFPLIKKYLGISINISFVFSQYWGYIFLGYLISKLESQKKWAIFSSLISFIIFFVSIVGTILLKRKIMFLDYTNNFSLTMIALCFCLFYACRYFNINIRRLLSNRTEKVIIIISNLTFSIYLSHALILDIFQRGVLGIKITPHFTVPFFGAILLAFLVFIICLLISLIWRQLGLLKYKTDIFKSISK